MSMDAAETPSFATETLTIEEAARVLGVKKSTLTTYVREGQMPGTIRFGRVTRISRSAVDRILTEGLEVVREQERRRLRAVRRTASSRR